MESQERKRRGDVCDGNGEPARRARRSSDEVLEDEVKEFFAILHRIRDATGGSDRRGDSGGDRTAVAGKEGLGRWRPTFKLEDFEEAAVMANEASSGGGALLVERESACIDLNVLPETESPLGS